MAEIVEVQSRLSDLGHGGAQHAATLGGRARDGRLAPGGRGLRNVLNRAFDQVLLDMAMQRLPVTFVLDRAGITGPDSPSHDGSWDMSVFGVGRRRRCGGLGAPRRRRTGAAARHRGCPGGWHPRGNRAQILADLGLTAQDVAREVTDWVSLLGDPAGDATRVDLPAYDA